MGAPAKAALGRRGRDYNPPHRCLESIQLDAENLYNLLDLMLMHSETINGVQLERLLGLALNLSDDIQQWFGQENERRENEPD